MITQSRWKHASKETRKRYIRMICSPKKVAESTSEEESEDFTDVYDPSENGNNFGVFNFRKL